jgi:hypothetical protein
MKKALILLLLFGVGMTSISLFSSSPEASAAKFEAPITSIVQERTAVPTRTGFDVEVLVNGVPLPEYYARGRNYIEALEGAEYTLRIRNPLGERVAVALSVDGLNSIDARHTSASDASKWVIEPYGTISISGWQMSSNRARRFYFTTERDSYGGKLGQTSNLGIISAVFFRERHPVVIVRPQRRGRYEDGEIRSEEKKAPDYSAGQSNESNRDKSAPSSKSAEAYPGPDDESAATGIGRNVHNDVRWINMDLENRATSEVTLRYEYRAGLVRLGIRPYSYPYPNPDTLPRRERASGFEDRRYSPEP